MRASDDFHRWEARVKAFAALCPEGPVQEGPLQTVRVGVKDIIDVRGVPTRNGSRVFAEAAPAAEDAPVVKALRAAGATIIGKTTTTEFAFTDPTPCRNPYDLDRSPGGSSSGSGAGVAAGIVDLALGTQTAGSLIRPAAYCGAVAFKPTYGLLPTRGVTPLAPSFDTVGVIARSVGLASAALHAMAPDAARTGAALPDSPVTVAVLQGGTAPADAAREAFDAAGEILAAGCAEGLTIPTEAIVADHRLVMIFEAARAHGELLTDWRRDLLHPGFRAAIEAGSRITAREAEAGAARLEAARAAFWARLGGIDAVLTMPVPDGAPLIDGTTGFQDWLTPWTVFGGPLAGVPWGLDGLGRPRAVMLAAAPGRDAALLHLATRLEAAAPHLPRPRLPA